MVGFKGREDHLESVLEAATHTHGAHVSGRKASQLTLTSIPTQYPPATKHRPAGSHLCLEGRDEQVVVSGNTQLCRIHATVEGRPVLLAVVAVLLIISPCIDGVLQRLFCSCCLRDVSLCSLTALEGVHPAIEDDDDVVVVANEEHPLVPLVHVLEDSRLRGDGVWTLHAAINAYPFRYREQQLAAVQPNRLVRAHTIGGVGLGPVVASRRGTRAGLGGISEVRPTMEQWLAIEAGKNTRLRSLVEGL